MNFTPSQIRALVRIITQRTGAPVHDEDLEQDAALRAVEAFRRNRAVEHPKAFLMKIVRDAVRDHWRRRRHAAGIDSIDERLMSQSPSFEDALDRRRRAELVRQAIERLCPTKRILLQLFYEQDCSVSEIARLQGRSVSAVKMDLVRSRRKLARILRRAAASENERKTWK